MPLSVSIGNGLSAAFVIATCGMKREPEAISLYEYTFLPYIMILCRLKRIAENE
jgi:hypothetical protein